MAQSHTYTNLKPTHTHTSQLTTRKISLNTDSPIHTRPPASPLVIKSSSVGNFRRDSSPSMGGASSVTLPTVNVVPYVEDNQTLDRQGIIDITVDVQNFLAAISRLKQAMEEVDNSPDNDGEGCVCVCVRERERERE